MDDEVSIFEKIWEVLAITVQFLWTQCKVWYATGEAFFFFCIPPEPKDVSSDIVLITGAGHGMGREVAIRFAKLRATVICVDINAKGNEETVKLIKQNKGKVYSYECDVTDRSAILTMAEKIRKEVGIVTILVNNAGIMPCKSILQHSEKEIRLTMDINVNAILWMIQAFLPHMIDRNRGHIVSMSSMAGLMGSTNLVPYSGSKFAVRGIMESLSVELHDDPRDLSGIKFTTIFPFVVNTGLAKKPVIRFKNLMKVVEPGDAADQIVDAIRREYHECTVPGDLYYINKLFRNFCPKAAMAIYEFSGTRLDSHE